MIDLLFRWHLPTGVLFDLLGGGRVPWALTAHFGRFPEPAVMRLPSPEAVEALFLSTVKVL